MSFRCLVSKQHNGGILQANFRRSGFPNFHQTSFSFSRLNCRRLSTRTNAFRRFPIRALLELSAVVGGASFIVYQFFNFVYYFPEPCQALMDAALQDERVRADLGTYLFRSPTWNGNVNESLARMIVPLVGTRGTITIDGFAHREGDGTIKIDFLKVKSRGENGKYAIVCQAGHENAYPGPSGENLAATGHTSGSGHGHTSGGGHGHTSGGGHGHTSGGGHGHSVGGHGHTTGTDGKEECSLSDDKSAEILAAKVVGDIPEVPATAVCENSSSECNSNSDR
eukprot:829299_1